MRPIWALLLYLAAVFVGGGLLAPWLYWGADLTGLMETAGRPPFHRFVTRCLLLVALVGILPLLRFSRLDSWRGIGLAAHPRRWRRIAQGFVVGFISLAVVGAGALAAGVREWHVDGSVPPVALVLLGVAATAIIVAVL